MQRLKVLVLSRTYPNNIFPIHGLWVQRLTNQIAEHCDLKLVAPVQYCPPLPGLSEYYTRFRRIEQHRASGGIEVFHPRYVVAPGITLQSTEAVSYYFGVVREVDRIRKHFPFDAIHAHFSYPDGVVAAKLGQRYNVPVIITEHAPWNPWLNNSPLVRRQVLWAARQAARHVAPSASVRDEMVRFTLAPAKLRVIPNGVDGSVFKPALEGAPRRSNQIVFAGFINYVKGIDILLNSMRKIIENRPDTQLLLVGGGYYRAKKVQEDELRRMAHDLGIDRWVSFVGPKPPEDVVRYMQESAVFVLPSRSESFGSVLIEALACGTPVVTTRCGGPEDIVTDDVGRLVPTEDPEALAAALEDVMANRDRYDPDALRRYVLGKFGWDHVARAYVDLYREVSPSPTAIVSEGAIR